MDLELQLFESFRLDRLNHALPGYTLECLPHLRRHVPLGGPTGGEALICFSQLDSGVEAAQIEAQIEHFRRRKQDFEWKVYALERPADLKQMLEKAGFKADEPECFMLYPLKGQARRSRGLQGADARQEVPMEVEIRRIVNPKDLDDVLAVQAAIWGRDFEWLRAKLALSLKEAETMSMFCAYAHGQPIGSGWTDYPRGSRFPELHGGAVLPAWRGRGVYSALFDCRFEEAQARGFEWMAVDASPMSLPILQAMGFLPICMTWPLRYFFASEDKPQAQASV
ncbi:GNAT family N-acetyltransferase [Roseateles sp.]|uniref:GNAT family N-acetyltransferase n=1 Tax=Roseateles sp. TaxID=1971397 RepID=UPI003BA5CF05